ncbi:MAG TPA: M20/M25/M40 family metallo-hydrolase [Gemmatimonadaceae bacterium]|jgi:glutamate carboxypeptidase|nr:M20/M25/M40 family metallo-hydrolase [Gemmatimonadaceae bacterium]
MSPWILHRACWTTVAVAAALSAGARFDAPLRAQSAQPTKLTATERSIAAAVEAHNGEALSLLERVVNINSGTLNLAGVRQVGDVLRPRLEALGFSTRWVDGAAFHRAGHLVAEHARPGRKILLIGHLDTVFEPDNPFQRFERLNDSTARGPGVIDMKGGDVIILYALRALADAGFLDKMNVGIIFDGDEEEPGAPLAAAREALVDEAKGAQAALGFEDGAGDPKTAVIARRGAGSWTLVTGGIPAHSSQIFKPEYGAGAVYEASRILHEFYTTLSGERYLTFNPGLAIGGTLVTMDTTGTAGTGAGKTNVVAEHMRVTGDLRTLSPEQRTKAKKAMTEIVSHHLPKTTAEISFDDGYPPMAPTAGNRRLLAIYDAASRDLGLGAVVAVDPSRAGAADVSFVAGIVPMIIDGIGLSGHDDHSQMETANLRMLPAQTKRAALVLYRLARPSPME